MENLFANAAVNEKREIDYRIIRRDGSVRILHSQRQVKELTPDGKPKIVIGVDQDVTEQRQAEEALRLSEDRFRAVAEAANIMVYETDLSTGKIRVLRGLKQLVGYKPEEVEITVDWVVSRMNPEDVPHVMATYNEVANNPYLDKYVLEYRFLHKNGHYITVKDTAKAVKDKNGKTVLFVGGIRDITQRRRDQQKIRQYNKHLEQLVDERTKQLVAYERFAAIGQVAGMVGHDIRNPLQALTSETYLLKTDLSTLPKNETTGDMKECLSSIEQNIGYINRIIADLQDYSRQLKPDYRTVSLSDLLAEMFETITVPTNIQLSFDIKDAQSIKVDPTFLRRTLTNLINNAIQAMPDGGELKIYAHPHNHNLIITVADTGVGVPDEVKDKLFKPMFTTKAKGQGLGLAVVKRLVEVQGGTIRFESKVGVGTKFFVTLPLNSD
jgi:PAS domain S-box-containing protein